MERFLEWLKIIAAAIGGLFAWLWGPWDALIAVLIAVVIIDYLTGLANAFIHKKVSSATGFQGFFKKLFIFLLVAIGALLDRVVPAANGAIRGAVCMFYIANEGISIVENAGAMGLPLPDVLKRALKQLSAKSEDAIPPDVKPPDDSNFAT